MPRSGPRSVRKYSDEFKLTAVRLSHQPGLQVKTVAAALEIHPLRHAHIVFTDRERRRDVTFGTPRHLRSDDAEVVRALAILGIRTR